MPWYQSEVETAQQIDHVSASLSSQKIRFCTIYIFSFIIKNCFAGWGTNTLVCGSHFVLCPQMHKHTPKQSLLSVTCCHREHIHSLRLSKQPSFGASCCCDAYITTHASFRLGVITSGSSKNIYVAWNIERLLTHVSWVTWELHHSVVALAFTLWWSWFSFSSELMWVYQCNISFLKQLSSTKIKILKIQHSKASMIWE